MAGGSSSASSSHHHRSSGARGSGSSSSSSTFSTSGLFKTNGRLATVGSTVGERIPNYIPGFKTSATFLSSLSANLRIPDDAILPSPISTPVSLRAADSFASHNFPPPSPLAIAMSTDNLDSLQSSTALLTPASSSAGEFKANPLEGVPELSTFVVTDEQDRIDALKLVADSVAQQRQLASRILISYPINIGAYVLLLAIVGQYLYKGPGDWAILFTTYVGITMMSLVLVRWLVAPYIVEAEKLNWEWLGDDIIIVTKYGDRIIGALILGWESPGPEKGKSKKKRGGKGLIRGWTVLLKYRGKGEGRALLEEAVHVTQKKGGDGLEFEDRNVYSTRILPKIYNSGFDLRDQKARLALDKAIKEQGSFSKRR